MRERKVTDTTIAHDDRWFVAFDTKKNKESAKFKKAMLPRIHC